VDTNSSNTSDSSKVPNALSVTSQPEPSSAPEIEPTPRNRKASYESNADVQRWLREQELERAGTKPPFNPTFLAHQRDRPWVLSSLETFYEDDLITDVLAVVSSGKEATVYCCSGHPSTGLDYVAAKVYRPRMFRSLRNDAVYRASRPQVDALGREGHGAKRWNATAKESERGRAAKISAWIRYEYETQRLLYDAGADVPRPLAQSGNATLMEYVGGGPGTPAPLLREATMEREEAAPLFERVLRNIELWLACDRVHGDLSAYNMLYWEGAITIIDFAQAVDPRYNPAVADLLARDIARVCQYFTRFGVQADAGALASDLWLRYLRADL
jgi:RIO kinase 1